MMKRALPWLFIALASFAVMTLYLELSRALHVPPTFAPEFVAVGVSVFTGAFVLWRKTRPNSTLPLVLYVPMAVVAVFFWYVAIY